MDKNHANRGNIYEIASSAGLNTLVCHEPFLKAAFIHRMLRTADVSVCYLDFDLMYSGYVKGRLVEKPECVKIYRPGFSDYLEDIKKVTEYAAKEKCLVILDTLNGFFNVHGGEDAARIANACLSLLAFAAKSTDSSVMVACTASHIDKKWILSPQLGRIMHHGPKIALRRKGVHSVADLFDHTDARLGSFAC